MRFAICNELFGDDAFASLPAIAAAGYDGVEVAPFTLAPEPAAFSAGDRRRFRQRADAEGLVVTGLHWLLARSEGMHVSSADPEVRERTLGRLNELSALCADLGGRYLVFGSPAQRSTPPGMSRADARARAVELFAAWAEHAERDGTVVCLEALPAEETDFMNSTDEVLDIVDAVDSPAAHLVLDVKSMSAEARPIPEQIAAASTAGHLAYVQANDANRGGPGFGDTDFVPIFAALDAAGYDGFVSAEPFDVPTGIEDVAVRGLAYLRDCAARAGMPQSSTPTLEGNGS